MSASSVEKIPFGKCVDLFLNFGCLPVIPRFCFCKKNILHSWQVFVSAAFAEDPCAWMVCHVLAMKSHHDLRGLRNGLGMLRDSWLRFCRTGKCHSVGLRSAILVLLRRMGSTPATS